MAQRGTLPPLRVTVPTLGNSASMRLSKYHITVSPSPTPIPVIYQRPHSGRLWIAVLLELSSLYAAHQWLIRTQEQSLVKFAFLAFSGASVVLGFSQRPWKGRAISSSQWGVLFINGALLALSFVLRMRGLADIGPLETILAEFTGAVLGKLFIKTRKKVYYTGAKVRGAIAFLAGLFLLSQGWAASSCSPLSTLFVPATKARKFTSARLTRSTRIGYTAESRSYIAGEDFRSEAEKDCAKYAYVIIPFLGGLLSSLQRLPALRTVLTNIPKKRLQALTYVAAGAVFFPVATFQFAFQQGSGSLDETVLWPLLSVIAFGMVLAFYGDLFSEERLLISPFSPFHFFVTFCCVCLLELMYGSNFSLLGFVVCSTLLGVGVRAGACVSEGLDWNSISEKEYSSQFLLSIIKTPMYHIWKDVKTRKIAMFLLLNTSFMVVEFLYGFLSNSLGLISDACHMLFDCAALAIGLYASYISHLPPNSKFNFGYGRFEVLSGYANAVFLILVAALIVLESLERLLEPPEISTESLLVVSVGGLLVNVVGLIFFHEAHHHAHGSAPCTHLHVHRDEIILSATPEHREGSAEISLTRGHTLASVADSLACIQHPDGELGSSVLHPNPSPKVHDCQGFLSSDSHGTRAKHGDGHSLSPTRTTVSDVQQVHIHNQWDCFVERQVATEQVSCQTLISCRDHELCGAERCRADPSSLVHGHQLSSSKTVSQGKSSVEQPHLLSEHQHHNHSEGCFHDHNYDHAESTVPQHSLSQPAQQHAGGCSDNHGHQLGQHNAFVQLFPGKHEHSEACSDNCDHYSSHSRVHGHPSSHNRHLHHSHSQSDDQQVGVHSVDHHNHNHGISNKDTWAFAAKNVISIGTSDHSHGHKNEYHHHYEEGGSDVSWLGHNDGARHTRQHVSQPCSHDHEHHERGKDYDCGHNQSSERNNHDHQVYHHNHGGNPDEHGDLHHIDHNMEGIFLHILADTLGSVGVVISTLLIKYKGWLFTDPACSIFISVLIVSSVLPLVRNSAELLLQRVPRSAEKRIQGALRKVEKLEGVHDWHKLHVWSYTNTELVGTLRLHASVGSDKQLVRKKVSQILQDCGIVDLTIEVEDLEHADDQ